MIRVQSADGKIHEFPDGTSNAVIDRAMKAYVGQNAGGRKAGALEDFGKSLATGLNEGFGSIADAVLEVSPVGQVNRTLTAAARLVSGEGAKPVEPQNALTRRMGEIGHQPETRAGRYGRAVGQNIPNALVGGGGMIQRGANVIAPAVLGEGAAEAAEAVGADERGQTIARVAGAVAGSGVASIRPRNARPAPPDERVPNALLKRTNIDPARARAEADRFRAAGVEPTLTDVVGEKGRRFIRAVGVKHEDTGEALTGRAREVSAGAKPAIMDRTRQVGPETGKSADEVAAGIKKARNEAASTDYAEPYKTRIPLTDETLTALNDEPGRAAMRRARLAAVARQDQEQIAELDTLLKMNPPPTDVSAGTLDRIRIAMRGRAKKLSQSPDTADIGAGLTPRVGMIDDTLNQVPELAPARADYKAKSQALGVLGKERKDVYSTDPADYASWLDSLPEEAREANKVAIRQEILDTLGGQRASTFGSVDELATSPYVRDNLAMALGPDEARSYLANLQARLDQVRNASFVSPNAGSRTAVLENDISGLKEVGGAVGDTMRGNIAGLAQRAAQWFASRGINEREAQTLSEAAIDPRRLDELLNHLERRYGQGAAQDFIQWRQAILPGAVAATAAARAPQQ